MENNFSLPRARFLSSIVAKNDLFILTRENMMNLKKWNHKSLLGTNQGKEIMKDCEPQV